MDNTTGGVVVVGNVGIDTNVYLYAANVDFIVESNFTENLDYVGQAGGYTARGYAAYGLPTAFIGHVGDDFSGRLIRETFAADGIDTRALFVDPAGTARSVNFMTLDGRRKNFYDGKGHMTLSPDLDLCSEALRGARLAHFHLPNWARRLLPIARELGLTIACDVQDVVDASDPYRQEFVRAADILFFSAANHADPSPLMRCFLDVNPEVIVIAGMGAAGCALGKGQDVRFFPPPLLDMPIVDTNGAGDALAVGFLSSYLFDSYSLEDSILRGQIAARHTCSLRATTDCLITRSQLDASFAAVRANGRR
jgi:sugar/nucleoside kinase (ribokinase family)